MVSRRNWLKKIRPFYENELVKVIVGIRRCGKSVLLKQIYDEISADEAHKIFINFEDLQFSYLRDEESLYSFIKSKIIDKKKYYLFFDEIQIVPGFEKTINSFRLLNTSIFITGSDTKILSGEPGILLAGKYVSFKVMPFSFSESMEMSDRFEADDDALMDYIRWGGMPHRFSLSSKDDLRIFLSDLYDSIVLKDIVVRCKVQNVELLNKIVTYISANMSQILSGTAIVNFLKSENCDCSKETLYNYISYITSSCLVNKSARYDIRTEKRLSTMEKYYLTDVAFARVHTQKIDIAASMENIVHNELLCRGYDVQVGVMKNNEITFIAQKGSKKKYFQVCHLLENGERAKREFSAFSSIYDSYPKFVLSADHSDFSRNGIVHKNIIDWLLKK